MNLVQLTLLAPRHLEDALVEKLLAHPEWATGFTLAHTEGQAMAGERLSVRERVRGRIGRCELLVVLEAGDAEQLLAELKEALPSSGLRYWITPVIEMGSLA